jgi:hypothetical protein
MHSIMQTGIAAQHDIERVTSQFSAPAPTTVPEPAQVMNSALPPGTPPAVAVERVRQMAVEEMSK